MSRLFFKMVPINSVIMYLFSRRRLSMSALGELYYCMVDSL